MARLLRNFETIPVNGVDGMPPIVALRHRNRHLSRAARHCERYVHGPCDLHPDFY